MAYRTTPPPSYTFSVPGFTRAVKVLIIATSAVWVLQYVDASLDFQLRSWFALFPQLVVRGEIWRLASYLFLHAGLSHLFWNMFALWMFGVWVEEELGSRRLYQLYFVSGIGGGVVDSLAHLWLRPGVLSYTIGASAAIYGVLLAVGVLFPERPVFLLLPPVTIKAKWLVLGYGALEFLFTLHGAGADGVAHFAHLGGMLFAFLYLKLYSPQMRLGESYGRWRRKQMQKRFEVYMNQRDRRNPPPGGWRH
ncbi:MAG: rhomboid family intramembrane serine protease [Terriglobales bacterium]